MKPVGKGLNQWMLSTIVTLAVMAAVLPPADFPLPMVATVAQAADCTTNAANNLEILIRSGDDDNPANFQSVFFQGDLVKAIAKLNCAVVTNTMYSWTSPTNASGPELSMITFPATTLGTNWAECKVEGIAKFPANPPCSTPTNLPFSSTASNWFVVHPRPIILFTRPENGTNLIMQAGTTTNLETKVLWGTNVVTTGSVAFSREPTGLGEFAGQNPVDLNAQGTAAILFNASTNGGLGKIIATATGLVSPLDPTLLLPDVATNVTLHVPALDLVLNGLGEATEEDPGAALAVSTNVAGPRLPLQVILNPGGLSSGELKLEAIPNDKVRLWNVASNGTVEANVVSLPKTWAITSPDNLTANYFVQSLEGGSVDLKLSFTNNPTLVDTATLYGVEIKEVIFEKFADNAALDANAGGVGERIFPDKMGPDDQHAADRRKVRVLARLNQKRKGVTVFFKLFDVDDPDPRGIDSSGVIDTNGTKGDDNSRDTNGQPNRGTLSAASAETDENGEATVELTVSMQPGDSFRVAASCIAAELDLLTVDAPQSASHVPANNDAQVAGLVNGKLSHLLTVWRKLHMEVDSMKKPPEDGRQKNFEAGKVIAVDGAGALATTVTVDQNLADGSKKLDNRVPGNLGNGRFEKGQIKIGKGEAGAGGAPGQTETRDLKGNGHNYVEKTVEGGIKIPFQLTKDGQLPVSGNVTKLNGHTFTVNIAAGEVLKREHAGGKFNVAGVVMTPSAVIPAKENPGQNKNPAEDTIVVAETVNIPFKLHDDDHDDRLPRRDLPLAWLMTAMADAYVDVVEDGGGDKNNNKETVPFVRNAEDNPSFQAIMNSEGAFESKLKRADNFWIAWLCAAFQPGTAPPLPGVAINQADGDPDSEVPLIGITLFEDGFPGSLIFMETLYDRGTAHYEIPELTLLRQVVAHEIGHTFDLPDRNNEVNAVNRDSLMGKFWLEMPKFAPVDIKKIRSRVESPGK